MIKQYVGLGFIATWCMFGYTINAVVSAAGKEIEIKFTIINPQEQEVFKTWVEKNGISKGLITQEEHYLIGPKTEPKLDPMLGFKDAQNTLRIRITPKENYVTMKYRHLDASGKTISRDEIESSIKDPKALLKIFANLGYDKETILYKKRTSFDVKNTEGKPFEIAFDEVRDKDRFIGNFIEVELKFEPESVESGNKAIFDLLLSAGVTHIMIYDRGYIHMSWNPGYNFGQGRILKIIRPQPSILIDPSKEDPTFTIHVSK